jgi:PIN domain nuclease of toxin-antitoxin system
MVYQNAASCDRKRGDQAISAVRMPDVVSKILNLQGSEKFEEPQTFISARYTDVSEAEVDQVIAKAAAQLRARIAAW